MSDYIPEQVNWKPIPGFEHRYEVSDTGLVRRIKAHGSKNPAFSLVRQRPFRETEYMAVALSNKGLRLNGMVHRLVMLAFVGVCPSGMEVNHIDLNKKNNRLSNLEYITHQRNMLHAFRTRTRKRPQKRI